MDWNQLPATRNNLQLQKKRLKELQEENSESDTAALETRSEPVEVEVAKAETPVEPVEVVTSFTADNSNTQE